MCYDHVEALTLKTGKVFANKTFLVACRSNHFISFIYLPGKGRPRSL